MFRLWAKLFKNNKIINDYTAISSDYNLSRTSMIMNTLTEICNNFDLAQPIWLTSNINDFKRNSKTRFYKDNFIENIDFDFLEIQVIEE